MRRVAVVMWLVAAALVVVSAQSGDTFAILNARILDPVAGRVAAATIVVM